jgi:acetylornithine deacetylase/succinyl-diaminopimelate desuccinylase-like protein
MKLNDLQGLIDQQWDESILPELIQYVKIPAKSPAFDPSWDAHGHLKAVVAMAHAWSQAQASTAGETPVLAGMKLEMIEIEGKTPCIFFDVPATGGQSADHTILFYGHLDKQPEMTGWRDHLGPWKPVIEQGRLYGRGSADDGYAIYAAMAALASLDRQSIPRPRCVGLIETCEESGSPDLPAYIEHLKSRLGQVRLVIGLDSGCGNYEQLWITTSLRGLVGGVLSVEILEESIPPERVEQAKQAGSILGDTIWKQFPWVSCSHAPAGHEQACLSAQPTSTDPVEAILNRTWRPALSVTGAASLPSLDMAGNVLRPKTVLKLSMRIPPTVDAELASRELKQMLERDAPYQARVNFEADWAASGWHAPAMPAGLSALLNDLSLQTFAKPAAYMGEGGTIPFMNMLGRYFPEAQFLITGVLGPQSNAHGPNEFLDIAYAKALTRLVAGVVAQAQV